MRREDFYRNWILANAAGEALGLGTTFALGAWLAPRLEAQPTAFMVVAGAIGAVSLGTLLEGVVVGAFQAEVLGKARPGLRRRAWILATALGAGAAWLLGMIPSTLMSLDAGGETPTGGEPGTLAQLLLAAMLGLALGPVLAAAQLFVLRRHADRAGRWVVANALAWAVGMPAIFAGMALLPWGTGGYGLIVGLFAVTGAAGAIVGAIHGLALLKMLRL